MQIQDLMHQLIVPKTVAAVTATLQALVITLVIQHQQSHQEQLFLLDQNPIHQVNHSKKVSLFFLQRIGYRNANQSQVLDC